MRRMISADGMLHLPVRELFPGGRFSMKRRQNVSHHLSQVF